jgi:hypothetical protein
MGAKAFQESTIPPSVKDHLSAQLESIPHSRLLLIKPPPQDDESLTFYVVIGRTLDPFYYSFELDHYEDLLELDIPMILADDRAHADKIGREAFYLVCTNGSRDPCCARSGLRAYRAIRELVPQRVWQCSHVGGHRFAANVLAFPHGIYYGRVDTADVPLLLEASDRGDVLLENYRGRACHDPVVQAAEALLRQQTGIRELAAFRMLYSTQIDAEIWSVDFLGNGDGAIHKVTLQSRVSEERDFVSCRSEKQAPVMTYHLESYDVVDRG